MDAARQLKALRDAGVDSIVDPIVVAWAAASRRCSGSIGHCGDTTDLDYLREIADAGSLLGMDRFGIDVFLPFEDRVTTVAALAKAGYADRMMLSHDAACYSDFYSESYKTALLPRWNYTHITDDVLPALREHGVDEAQITAMLVHNPARYFTGGQE